MSDIVLPEEYRLREGADPVAAQAFLTTSYWAEGISLEKVTRAIEGSFSLSIAYRDRQVAMARVISDFATIAYLADVYVLPEHRGLGLAKAMITSLLACPRLQGLRHWLLFTHDAQDLYKRFGWTTYAHPDRTMTLTNPAAYK